MVKPIEQLTITDDFMFGAVMRDPKLLKPLLEMILGVKIQRIEYPELQKTLNERYTSKSIRLDVYVADEVGTVYNVEIQTSDKKHLPRRTRYYQGMIDLHILEKGEDYTALQRSFVIFICIYDPFGQGRWVYTFENLCRENPAIALRDGATKAILNTKGSVGEISEDMKSLLRYMEGSAPDNDYTRMLDQAVKEVRSDDKWRREYMVLVERDRENRRLGERRIKVSQARAFRNDFSPEQLAKITFFPPYMLKKVLDTIDAHPDWDDEKIAETIDFE
ncbi:MAG: Rpn family recombination-promoting nuclease/putative transposase [Clostridia bacterium]|nr:Rpn family recombination-promoting nuclease/putative transposase [Clostridia bacterium]